MSYYRHLILSDPYLVSQVAHYPFDTNANDLINAQNGTSTNITYGVPAKIGTGSAGFNGTNSSITIPDNDNFSFGTGAFSINMWVYPTGGPGGYLISKRSTSFLEYQSSYTNSSSQIEFRLFIGSTGAWIGKYFLKALSVNTWQMITFTFSGGLSYLGLKLYVNGVESTPFTATNSNTYTGMPNTTAPVVLGKLGSASAGYLNGRLDQTRIWKGRELTATEVLDIYNTLY